ncbi:MAG TPA: hypothetical protein VE863_10925, partial [Pyrinomonadaceae bacterium]|nr:hypothetical protein [Pyrinomonadaceae bacterium]
DGTQMKYEAFVSGWQATKITDRNGNYISINYYTNTGDIQNITDTLGRVITFEYVNGKLNRLLQNWNGGLHEWATFGWTTEWFTPNFSLTAAGAYSGVAALTQVGLPDGSYYTFDYAVAGQVKDIHRFSSDHVQRSSMAYDYTSPTDDCPRIYQTRASVDHWTGYNGVPAELTTQFLVYTNGWYQTILPDGTAYQEYYGSGWQKGLVLSTETWVRPDPNSSYARQKVTATQWTQDNESVSYQTNPRVKQTDIYDASWNDRRTTIDYQGPFGLPATITEFNADASTPLRRTVLEYKTDSYYNSRRLVGLLATKTVYDTNSNVVARTSYDYDAQGAIQSQAQYATQHDSGYDASFLLRGNVTSITRWDASDPNNQSKRLINNMTYDVAGNLLTTTDAGNPTRHTSTISYADQFSDSSNHNTFAYPTTLTDADGYSSYVQYNFDFGLKTLVTTPQPNGISNTAGPQQLIEYDSALQTQRVTSLSTGAYIRYLYGADYVEELHSEKISLTTRSPRNGSTARAILMQWPRTIPALRAAIKRS